MTRVEMRIVAAWLADREAVIAARREAQSVRARRQPRDARGRFISRQRILWEVS